MIIERMTDSCFKYQARYGWYVAFGFSRIEAIKQLLITLQNV